MNGLRTVSPVILWILLGVAFLVWIALSGILVYHWNMYSKGDKRTLRMKRTYFVGSVVLFLSAITFIFSL